MNKMTKNNKNKMIILEIIKNKQEMKKHKMLKQNKTEKQNVERAKKDIRRYKSCGQKQQLLG